jgi:hypothetical protein
MARPATPLTGRPYELDWTHGAAKSSREQESALDKEQPMRQRLDRNSLAILTILLSATVVRAEGPTSAPISAEETRKAFWAIIDRPKVDLAPQVDPQGVEGGIAKFHFSYASEAGERVPGILLAKEEILKDGKRHPAVIVLHGTGGSKESEQGAAIPRQAPEPLVIMGFRSFRRSSKGALGVFSLGAQSPRGGSEVF